jgi:tetratricopeptide (TPR) repeat protein
MLLRLLLPELAKLLRKRSTSQLFKFLSDEGNSHVIRSASARTREFQELIIIIAEAVELGYPDDGLLQKLLGKLPPEKRKGFSASLAKGVLAGRRGKSGASLFFRRALSEKSSIPKEHVAFARSCLSNVWRKRGKYEEARRESDRARRLAAAANLSEIEADFAVAGAWLHFHKGDPSKASALYDQAEPILRVTEDHRRLADVNSARGRIEQRAGRLSEASAHYEASLRCYDQCTVPHRGKGRTLINFAKLKWLQARKLGLEICEAQQRLGRTTLATYDLPAVSLDRINDFLHKHHRETISWEELQKLCDLDRRQYGRNSTKNDHLVERRAGLLRDAHALLNSANDFYNNHPARRNFRGLGRSSIIRAYLYIEERKWMKATHLANLTFELGKKHVNTIIQARAKIVETMACVQQCSNSIAHSSDQIALALDSGRQAVYFSDGLDDTRIKIKAHTWYAFAQLLQTPPNTAGALDSVNKIENLLIGMPDDYVTEDADMLKRQCEQVAMQQNHDPIQLAEILNRKGTWREIKESVLDLIVERLLRRYNYQIEPVRRELVIHPRRVRQVRDAVLSIRHETKPSCAS